MKKSNDLSSVLAALRRAREDPRMQHVRNDLRKAQREFEVLARSGKLDKRRLFRAAKMVSDALVAALAIRSEGSALANSDPDDQSTDDT